jgi:hypothetical protein
MIMFQRFSLSTIFSLVTRQEVGLGLYFTHGENTLLKRSSQITLEIRYAGDKHVHDNNFIQHRCPTFSYGNGPHPLWAGSRTALGKITASNISNCPNYCVVFYNIHIIYKCGCSLHNTTWQSASCRPML